MIIIKKKIGKFMSLSKVVVYSSRFQAWTLRQKKNSVYLEKNKCASVSGFIVCYVYTVAVYFSIV